MDAEPPHPSHVAHGLENTLAALDVHLSDAEKQAATLLKAARRLRRAAREGNVASLPAAIAAAQADAARTGEPFASAAGALNYDVAEAFASGAWLDELAAAAKAAGVVLVRRDGRVTAYPVALRLDGRAQGVRVGRKLERRIRPSFLAAQLKALQQRPERVTLGRLPADGSMPVDYTSSLATIAGVVLLGCLSPGANFLVVTSRALTMFR